ncbi:MAG: ribonuclease G [Bacteroidetes bacterium GWE2_29_8]|nr:MAG: ribonuclease G [Bacteroidetes bacterium GWE2_29_8]
MIKELYIDSTPNEVSIALLEDKKLVELYKEKSSNKFAVGDIYLAKVKKLVPSLNAAFIDVGFEKDAFLHYLDLGHKFTTIKKFTKSIRKNNSLKSDTIDLDPDIEKSGKISDVLSVNENIIIQIVKEPISNKGPRVTSEICIAGRNIVLIPFSDRISISQKIKSNEERTRLKKIVSGIKPKNFGVIIRTIAENKAVQEIETDLNDLLSKWNNCVKQINGNTPPVKLLGEIGRTSSILRDHLNDSFSSININDTKLYDEIKSYLTQIAPDKIDILKLYKGKVPIFENFNIEKQIIASFGKTASFKNGGYLIIEHTEALHVIDVNSGHGVNSQNSSDENVLQINIDAAIEIIRQLRLRDMGGIIVIDFIDMQKGANRRVLYQTLKELMKYDKAKHNILPPSKFGLVQITRQRVRPEMNIETVEKCPTCNGTGEVKSTLLLTDDIESNIKYLLREQNEKKLSLVVHPYIAAYLSHGLMSIQIKWFIKFNKWIKIVSTNNNELLEYYFLNKKNDEIRI